MPTVDLINVNAEPPTPSIQPQPAPPPPTQDTALAPQPFASPSAPPHLFPRKTPPRRILLFLPLLLIGLLLVFLAIRFLGNLGGKGSRGEPITLSYWGLWEPENVMQGIISDFESSHPKIKISYVRKSHQDYRERLQSSLAGQDGPDIFRFHNTWVPMLKNDLAPLPSQVIDNQTFEKTFYPVAISDLKQDGKYVGVPLMVDTLLLYYNEDILTSAGVTPPQTWDDLLSTSLSLKQGGITAIAMGNSVNVDHWQDILALLMLQNGTDMKKPGSSIGSDNKNLGADALTYYTLFTKDYKIWNETLPNSTLAFASGKVAFYLGPSWRAFDFAKNPNLRFKTTPTPRLEDVETHIATYWADGVSEKSKYPKEAWEFLKFLTQKENLQRIYEDQAKTRLFGEPPGRIDMANQFSQTPILEDVLSSAPKAVSSYLASFTWDGDTGLNSRLSKYFEDAVTSVNQASTAEDALKTVDQGVSQIFQQYGIR